MSYIPKMPQTPRKRNSRSAVATSLRGLDINTPQRRSGRFPDVGMTLSSYQRSSNTGRNTSVPFNDIKPSLFKRIYKKITLKRAFLTLLTIVLVIGLYLGGTFLNDLHKAFGGNIFDLLRTTHLKGEDTGRVNILLAGNSSDDPGHTGGNLTDSIMLVSLDTKNNTGWMLSIPRDLLTNISNHGYQKINAVYEYGQADNFSASGYPPGGMGELEQIVSQNFGIPIDYYALINYSAFKQSVDAVGGISINIQSSDPRGLYDAYTNLKLPNGKITLNGQKALNLARARGDTAAGDISYGFTNSDFDRTLHQRQMLEALKSKATSTGVIANPIALSKLFNSLGNNVKTDLTLSDTKRLYDLSKIIPNSKIQSLSLNNVNGKSLLAGYMYYGQETLIPASGVNDYSSIQTYVSSNL